MSLDSYPRVPPAPMVRSPREHLRALPGPTQTNEPDPSHSSAAPGEAATLRTVLRDALDALRALPDSAYQLDDPGLTDATQLALALMQHAELTTIALTHDALERGTIDRSTAANTKQWVQRLADGEHIQSVAGNGDGRDSSGPLVDYTDPDPAAATGATSSPVSADRRPVGPVPGIETGTAHRIATLATACREPRNQILRDQLRSGHTAPAVGHTALRNIDTVTTVLPDADRDQVFGWLLSLDATHTSRDVRLLVTHIVATYGGPDHLDHTEDRQQQAETLTWSTLPTGLVRLTADLSKGHAAIITHAIQALAAPTPAPCDTEQAPDSGRDTRSPGKRRSDALIELIDAAARALHGPDRITTRPAQLVVTFDYDTLSQQVQDRLDNGDLRRRPLLRAGRTDNGDLINPATLRTLACDADLIPMILARDGTPLDIGRRQRLFTGGLRRAIIERDRHCTYRGCDRPPGFCQAHHLISWWTGGHTSLNNAALLCQRHHTIVHRDRLTAKITDGHIIWDPTPGRMPLIPAHQPGPRTG